MALGLVLAAGPAGGGCAEDSPRPAEAATSPGTEIAVLGDAAVAEVAAGEAPAAELARDAGAPAEAAPAPEPEPVLPSPAGGFHLDGDAIEYRPRPVRQRQRKARPVELVLRSSPPGAIAAIDGTVVGTTPTFWSGEVDGRAREFTFVKEGYAMARYRFVPTQGGIVHGTLEPLTRAPADAGGE